MKLRSENAAKANAIVNSLVKAKPATPPGKRNAKLKGRGISRDPLTRVDIVGESLCGMTTIV